MGPIDNCWRGLTLRILKHVDHLSTWESRHVRRPRMTTTDLNTWIAGSHGFAYSSMRATGNPSAAILLQSKHWIDTLTKCTCQCMKCNRWQVFSFIFHENSEKKNGKVPHIFKTLTYLLKIAKKNADVNKFKICAILNHSCSVWYQWTGKVKCSESGDSNS